MPGEAHTGFIPLIRHSYPVKCISTSYPVNASKAFIPLILILILIFSKSRLHLFWRKDFQVPTSELVYYSKVYNY